jgi:hypothetical protein
VSPKDADRDLETTFHSDTDSFSSTIRSMVPCCMCFVCVCVCVCV